MTSKKEFRSHWNPRRVHQKRYHIPPASHRCTGFFFNLKSCCLTCLTNIEGGGSSKLISNAVSLALQIWGNVSSGLLLSHLLHRCEGTFLQVYCCLTCFTDVRELFFRFTVVSPASQMWGNFSSGLLLSHLLHRCEGTFLQVYCCLTCFTDMGEFFFDITRGSPVSVLNLF